MSAFEEGRAGTVYRSEFVAWAMRRYYEITLEVGNPANYSLHELAREAGTYAAQLWETYEVRVACGQLELLERDLQESRERCKQEVASLRESHERALALLRRFAVSAKHTLICDNAVYHHAVEFKEGCSSSCLGCAVKKYLEEVSDE